jgi:hypothetical protein
MEMDRTLFGVRPNGDNVCQTSYNPNTKEGENKADKFRELCIRHGLLVVSLEDMIKQTLKERNELDVQQET